MTKFIKVDADIEKQLLVGLITSDSFVKRVLPVFEYDYLDLPPVKKMSKWCIEYYRKYDRVPYAVAQDIFNDRKRELDEDEAKWMYEFLLQLSEKAEKQGFNEEYIFDCCVKYFRKQKLLKASKKVQDLLADGKDDQAQRVWLDSMSIPEADDLGTDPFDLRTVKKVFAREKARVSLSLGIKSLDKMVGPVKSGWLAIFMGPMKRGKTTMLFHVAVRGVVKGYNVVFISLEQEEEDNVTKVWMNIGSMTKETGKLDFPYFDGSKVAHESYRRPLLNERNVVKTVKMFSKAVTSPRLRIKTYPMSTGGIDDFRQYLDLLEVYENFSPHVIVVDYLGIMKSPKGSQGRDVYNENSKALKALGQERKAAVFTGHQGSRATLEKINMSPSDMPEDIRIFANVDALYGLNQTDEEMDEGVMRINVLGHRHRRYTRMKQAKVLQQFDAGQFVLDDQLIDLPLPKDFKKGKEGLKGD